MYLYHHGIKGQKWGKRNGPPYPLNSDTIPKYYTVKKGSRIYRATEDDSNDFMNRRYTYVNITDDFANHNMSTSEGFSRIFDFDYSMKAKKDLKIASSNEWFEAVCDSNNINKNIYLDQVDNKIKNKGKYIVENILPHSLKEAEGGQYKTANNAIEYLINKGYDGVIDPIDGAHQQSRGEEPMSTIIFEPNKTLEIEDIYHR